MVLLLSSSLMLAEKIEVHGHRGARARLPENSLPAFEYAIGLGVDVLELDVAVTKDDALVVSHDPEMNPVHCVGPAGSPTLIREMTYAEVQRWDCGAKPNPEFPQQKALPGTRVPSLDQVFALSKRGAFHFNVETKIFPHRPSLTPEPERFASLLLALIRQHGLERRVIVQSFDFRTLKVMHRLAPEIRLSALVAFAAQDFVLSAREAGATIISPQFKLVTPEKVQAAHDAGLQVVPWTANQPADWDKLIAARADAIISDDPAALLEYLRARKLH
ncbi:MAG: glycerophosphodiester phosphodiesterase [Bryobacteraceae bacterium]|nr:glycerophosphodiester phosphodiesterase [Bryobacteraceae bacterium]